jgi:hypothetical protein
MISPLLWRHIAWLCEDAVKSVLRISSAHNKGGPADINIEQMLNLSNFFECLFTLRTLQHFYKVARYSYHKKSAQESRTNRVTILTRRSRKFIEKNERTSKMSWREQCSRHLTSLRVFYSVLCQLLTSLEFSILQKQCAISLYFVWWAMFKFCMLYCTTKNFHYTKNKKIL